ncbi:uncharacterized protein LOC118194916 [Stegodyphus dumicola]|uniref:uncharacterized protein LOC118194916 n=1 Tax=Stegodyphus dumicola TaxID=202533 RepID=UPI0015AE2E5A|nr:uncharacterized protein LOC118194916 [Stegodyphus dumicola]
MKLRTNNAMRNSLFTWITVVAVWLWLPYSIAKTTAETNTTKTPTLDQGTVQMLSNILESLDAFRNDRLKDLEKIRLAAPPTNGSTVSRSDTDVYKTPQNNSISEHIKALKEGIMGHNPVKKTFGYKVTVYTSPIGEDGKASYESVSNPFENVQKGSQLPKKKSLDFTSSGEIPKGYLVEGLDNEYQISGGNRDELAYRLALDARRGQKPLPRLASG